MNSKWTIISFQHSNNRTSYTWTHSAVNVTTELTPEQLAQAVAWAEASEVWFHSGETLFLCADAGQVTAVESVLDAAEIEYETEASPLTLLDRHIIEQAGITRRDQIEEELGRIGSTYRAEVTAVDTSTPRGITIQRGEIVLQCYGTMIPDVGDVVIVVFGDNDPNNPCVIGKVLGL